MLHKWHINTLKLNYGIYDYKNNIFNLENELDEPQLEKKPNLYYKNINSNYIKNSNYNSYKKSKSKSNNKLKIKEKR